MVLKKIRNGNFFDVETQKKYTKKSYKVWDNNGEMAKDINWGRYVVYDFDKDGAIAGSSGADTFTYYNVKFDKNKRQEIIIADATSEKTESVLIG